MLKKFFHTLRKNEVGSLSVEYIAIGVLALAVMTGIISYISGAGNVNDLGKAFLGKIEDVIDKVEIK